MRYRYLVDFRRGISVFAIFSYGIAVLGTPQCPPLLGVCSFFDEENPQGYSGFQVMGMTEWGQKSKPQKITKIHPQKIPCQISALALEISRKH